MESIRDTGDSQPSAIDNEDSDAIQFAAPMVCEVSYSEPEVSEVYAINLAATSASQPSASNSFAGARGSDAGAPQPGMSPSNISTIVTEVLEFGRIPVEIRHPRTKEEREETLLALGLRKKYLSDLDRLQIAALTEESKEKKKADREKKKSNRTAEIEKTKAEKVTEKVQHSINAVRRLGHYPRENEKPTFVKALR